MDHSSRLAATMPWRVAAPAPAGSDSPRVDPTVVVARARAAARDLVAACSVSPHALSQIEFSDLVAGCQQVINMVTGAQDAAIARLVSFDGYAVETGEWMCGSRGLGFVSDDGVDLVATATGMTRRYASNRVDLATSWAIDHTVSMHDSATCGASTTEPREAGLDESLGSTLDEALDAEGDHVDVTEPDPGFADAEPPLVQFGGLGSSWTVAIRTGLGRIHQALSLGRIDAYRAWVVASELDGTPAEAAAVILDRLDPHLASDTGPGLRRRIRRLQADLCPEVLQERYTAAIAKTGLTRDAREPGLDTWTAHLPAGDALPAWAAIDALARQYRDQDRHSTLERARAHALLDLVTGSATVTTTVIATLPATPGQPAWPTESSGIPPDRGRGPDPSSGDPVTPQPAPVDPAEGASCDFSRGGDPVHPHLAPVDPAEGASCDSTGGTDAIVGAGPRAALVRLPRPARRRATGRPAAPPGEEAATTSGDEAATSAENQLIEVTTTVTGLSPILLPRDALPTATHTVLCDPVSGALTDPEDTLSSARYRPGVAMAMFVRARDGRCRFPGCTQPAVHADLDHTEPWPTGRTTPRNLAALCRRHHRLKTLMRWRYRLDPDTAVATWTTPTGRTLTTAPLDHLHGITLPMPSPTAMSAPMTSPRGSSTSSPVGTSASSPRPGSAQAPLGVVGAQAGLTRCDRRGGRRGRRRCGRRQSSRQRCWRRPRLPPQSRRSGRPRGCARRGHHGRPRPVLLPGQRSATTRTRPAPVLAEGLRRRIDPVRRPAG